MDSAATDVVDLAVGDGIFATSTALECGVCIDALVDAAEDAGGGFTLEYRIVKFIEWCLRWLYSIADDYGDEPDVFERAVIDCAAGGVVHVNAHAAGVFEGESLQGDVLCFINRYEWGTE